MSLDVYLKLKGVQNLREGEHIFIREDGQTKEISRAEWERRFPDREPVTVEVFSDNETVYSANITHNLNRMAEAAGIYKELWRPEEVGIVKAAQLVEPLRAGLARLREGTGAFPGLEPAKRLGQL